MADTKSAPISQAGEPVSRIVRADTGMSASNRDRRPDGNCSANHPCDESIDDDVQVLQISSDLQVSHDDVRNSHTDVRVQGASPPADQRVLHGRAKGRISSTPPAQSVYTRVQRSDLASSRSTSSLHEKSKPGITLGETTNTPKSNFKFDGRAQSIRRSATGREDCTSPSGRGCFSPGQFDIPVSDSGYESDKVELSAAAVKSPVIAKFDQSNYTMEPKSVVITRPETNRPRKEFAPGRQQPIMSRERFIMTPNYVPKFERDGNGNPRPTTAPYELARASSTTMQQVLSVRMTDKKCICGNSQHCNCSTKPFIGKTSTDASRKVPFPRSNYKRIFNAQYPTGAKGLNFPSGKTANSSAEAQSLTRRILRQNRIEINQSASRVFSQSAAPLVDQSEPRVSTITVRPEATRVSPDSYKSRCVGPFSITAISETEDTSSTETSAISSTSNFATLTGSFQSHFSTFPSSTSRMTRTKQTARKERESRYPRATHPYVCGLCRHESTQSTNHRRHMLTHHALRLDGTQATAEEIARARGWNVAGRERRKAARATEAQPSSTAARGSSATARTSSTTEHPSSSRIRSREFVSTDESEEERPSTSSRRPTPAETAGHGSSRTAERSSHRSTTEHGSRRTTPALSDRDRPPARPERPIPTVHSEVEVPRKKRARDDHAGRDATPPRRAPRLSPRVELTRQEERPDLKCSKVLTPKEKPPVTTKQPPKKHQHPLPSTVGKKSDRKEPPSAALGAPPKSTSSTETNVGERHAQGESSTRGNDRTERLVATLVPRKPTESEALISLRQDLALSSSSTQEEEEEIPLEIDAGRTLNQTATMRQQ